METKICTKCGKELPIDQFNWRDKKAGTRRSECKFCHSNFMKQKYQEKRQAIEELKSQCSCARNEKMYCFMCKLSQRISLF